MTKLLRYKIYKKFAKALAVMLSSLELNGNISGHDKAVIKKVFSTLQDDLVSIIKEKL